MGRMTLGVIVGNRDFFPDVLVGEARRDVLRLLAEMEIDAVILDDQATKLGAVETWAHARRCADLFRANRDRIQGVLVTLPNFGDEKGVADTLKLAELNVPVLVQAYPDDLGQLSVERRRDAFCGKISVCNNLRQYGISYSLTLDHTIHPLSPEFRRDLADFVAQCRVVGGLRRARIGAVGARPNAFNTTRYSEKLLQSAGISVSTMDLSDLFGRAGRIADDDARVLAKIAEIGGYAATTQVPGSALTRMSKLAITLLEWMDENGLDATAIQCWSSMQQNFGVNVCTVMSMMSERLMPSACEVDIAGVVAMYALQLASGQPSALVDWNNNYGGDRNKCVFFHCGNWAKSFLPDIEIGTAPILGTTLGEENTYGAVAGRTPAGPVTFARISTDDTNGAIRAYVGEGRFTDDPLATFGSRAVVEVPELQKLMRYICRNGFEHHAAMNSSRCATLLAEALDVYLGWPVYHHEPAVLA
ncbi:L-fucose/L-arabinose isomerase family protein [uncultured Paludibaculum sp.]|uniref:L-fucose/L-arabinose isomerase family protein n=1 Tax=uncultured Paludibaculum sp. TaxID=1765020 RepID=UPI002AAB7763|nr:L-fucose/L-arabinose isomerase family protein [uncultured Paludibaculum sp.]